MLGCQYDVRSSFSKPLPAPASCYALCVRGTVRQSPNVTLQTTILMRYQCQSEHMPMVCCSRMPRTMQKDAVRLKLLVFAVNHDALQALAIIVTPAIRSPASGNDESNEQPPFPPFRTLAVLHPSHPSITCCTAPLTPFDHLLYRHPLHPSKTCCTEPLAPFYHLLFCIPHTLPSLAVLHPLYPFKHLKKCIRLAIHSRIKHRSHPQYQTHDFPTGLIPSHAAVS
jgi:hypothetical protein